MENVWNKICPSLNQICKTLNKLSQIKRNVQRLNNATVGQPYEIIIFIYSRLTVLKFINLKNKT